MIKIPRIGIGVLVIRDNKILLGKRLNSHGDGTWALPGGHLEFGETPQQCAVRETLEETGLQISNIQAGPWSSDIFEKEQKHYITLFMVAHAVAGEPKVLEPNKCERWNWFEITNLPNPLFLPLKNFLIENITYMSRIMVRYTIEKFPEQESKYYLKK